MNAPPDLVVEDDDTDVDDDSVEENPREVRRRARELAASIDPDAIRINAQWGEGVEKFKDIWDAGASARAKAAEAAPKPAKRKARR